jgi:uncharacterized protein YbjT (DUF2867 family)
VSDAMRQAPKLVTVFGATGFLGRNVVRALAKRGYRIRVAVRRPNLAFFLQPLATVGQIEAVQANLRYESSVARAVEGADAVVNCVGILGESGRQTFNEVQAEGARAIAQAVPPGVPLVHVSALGADETSPSAYARSKARGETALLAARPDAVILRPSVIVGADDTFFTRFASLARFLPVIPLAGADTRFQAVFVGDVAEAIARAVDGQVKGGTVYELGGPEVRTLRELVQYVLMTTGRRTRILPLSQPVARVQARVLEMVDALTLGLLPANLKLTRDQVALLARDNVVSAEANLQGRTFEAFGITPQAPEAIAPDYLVRFRKAGQFSAQRV